MTNHLVGAAEVAKLLGVSRQRVAQIVAESPDFPAPAAELSAGRVWSREEIQTWMTTRRDRVDALRCSFCQKRETDVERLVKGPGVNICSACIEQGAGVVSAARAGEEPAQTTPELGRPLLRCSFCNKSERQVRRLVAGPTVYICDECTRLAQAIVDGEDPKVLQQTATLTERLGSINEILATVMERLASIESRLPS